MTTTQTPAQQIEALEDEYNAMGRLADEHPERFGFPEQEKMDRVAHSLKSLYDWHDVDDWDRVL